MILSMDVETSGLVIKDRPLGDPAQPRIVQIGFVVQDLSRRELHTYATLVRPDGWEITAGATNVHGFTTDDCSRFGVDAKVALLNFVSALANVRWVVAHNLSFDAALVQRELDLVKAADEGLRRSRLRRICTMKTGLALMPDGKYPDLNRLYRALIGQPLEGAHDALADARATAACFWGLVDRRMIDL